MFRLLASTSKRRIETFMTAMRLSCGFTFGDGAEEANLNQLLLWEVSGAGTSLGCVVPLKIKNYFLPPSI